jgi:hypothetical protein
MPRGDVEGLPVQFARLFGCPTRRCTMARWLRAAASSPTGADFAQNGERVAEQVGCVDVVWWLWRGSTTPSTQPPAT